MYTYAPMKCRNCGSMIQPLVIGVDKPKAAASYGDCNYRCTNEVCGVAYTNALAESSRRMIQPDYRLNIPAHVRDGVNEALTDALNVRNRPTKRKKFAFESSEDALTWTVFRYLFER